MGLFGRASNLLKGFLRAPARLGGDRRSDALLEEELRQARAAERARKADSAVTPSGSRPAGEPLASSSPAPTDTDRKPTRRSLGPEEDGE